jgi:hypothetical protein
VLLLLLLLLHLLLVLVVLLLLEASVCWRERLRLLVRTRWHAPQLLLLLLLLLRRRRRLLPGIVWVPQARRCLSNPNPDAAGAAGSS